MGHIKRYPQIRKEHRVRYTRISKADLVEAFRDLYQETSGNELDDSDWIDDLERRVQILKTYRQHEQTEREDSVVL